MSWDGSLLILIIKIRIGTKALEYMEELFPEAKMEMALRVGTENSSLLRKTGYTRVGEDENFGYLYEKQKIGE